MSDSYGDLVAQALKAEADEARAEIREAGIICPSCGVNAADLPNDHMLELDMGGVDWLKAEKRHPSAKCQSGTQVLLAGDSPMDDASYETWQAAANVSLLDKFRKAEDEAFRTQVIGTGGGNFTGLLGVLDAS